MLQSFDIVSQSHSGAAGARSCAFCKDGHSRHNLIRDVQTSFGTANQQKRSFGYDWLSRMTVGNESRVGNNQLRVRFLDRLALWRDVTNLSSQDGAVQVGNPITHSGKRQIL